MKTNRIVKICKNKKIVKKKTLDYLIKHILGYFIMCKHLSESQKIIVLLFLL